MQLICCFRFCDKLAQGIAIPWMRLAVSTLRARQLDYSQTLHHRPLPTPTGYHFLPTNAVYHPRVCALRVEVRFQPLSIGSRKIHVHLVDVDSMEIVGAWLATATAMPPVVTKSYEVDLPVGRACHKRIAYSNPWTSTRLFRLSSSDPNILRPRYESLEVSARYRRP